MKNRKAFSKLVILLFGSLPNPVNAQHMEEFSIARDPCTASELALDLGGKFSSTGAIEILYALPDTDGRGDVRYAARDVICIPFSTIVDWEKNKSSTPPELTEYDATFLVTYDPRGTVLSARSRFDYDILMCEELPDAPRPPKELKFGTFNWTTKSGIKSQKISWIPDLRKKLEADCK